MQSNNQNTPAMSSEHVVVKREDLEAAKGLIHFAPYEEERFIKRKREIEDRLQAALDATSPAMVPWEDVEKLIKDIEAHDGPGFPHGTCATIVSTFNAKFKS